MLAPARIPVAAGKKMANMEKKVSSSLKSGPRFSKKMAATGGENQFKISIQSQSQPAWIKPLEGRPTLVAEEAFGLFALGRDEASYEVVGDGRQQDHQKDNLSLVGRRCGGRL